VLRFSLVPLFAEETLQAPDRGPGAIASENSSTRRVASDKPHPWLADAPPAYARLVDKGNVQIEVDQPTVEAAGKTALTAFSFTLKYRMRFRIQELAKDRDEKRRVRIMVSLFDVEYAVAHRILLRDNYRPTKPWDTALLQHEFDHVAISSDPRMLAMLGSLEGRKSSLVASPDEDTNVSEAWAQGEIEKSVKDLQQAVEKLVQQYYVRLDKISNNGLKTIEDRSKFFSEVYSTDDLKSMKFPFIPEVVDSLKKIKPEAISRHYLP